MQIPNPNRLQLQRKNNFSLLEVLIAFLIVVMCAIPLISPHVTIYRDQMQFIDRIAVDHSINVLYANIIEKMYNNDITFEQITSGQVFPIEDERLKSFTGRNLPYKGSYTFKFTKKKPETKEGDEAPPLSMYLYKLIISVTPINVKNAKAIEYSYDVTFALQLIEQEQAEQQPGQQGQQGQQPQQQQPQQRQQPQSQPPARNQQATL